MKLESLVIADQQVAVNTFPGLVHTARQAMEAGGTRSRFSNPQGKKAPKVKSVTRLSRNKVAVAEAAAGSPPF